ncbi:MAG: response regulator transcription factor [Bacteroidota bacterium]
MLPKTSDRSTDALDPIKVLIVEDLGIMQDGFRAIIDQVTDIEIVDIVEDLESALYVLASGLEPDLALIDIQLNGKPTGIDLAKEISRSYPRVAVLMQTLYETEEHVRESVRAGARGMVLKTTRQQEFLRGIREVASGKSYFCKEVANIMLRKFLPQELDQNDNSAVLTPVELTRRETDVLKLIYGEKSTREISEILHISPRTVDTHRRNLLLKTGSGSVVGLVKYAIRHQIYYDPDEF